jgi:hypothetical protein
LQKTIIILLILALAANAFAQKIAIEGFSLSPSNGSLFAGHKNGLNLSGPGVTDGKLTIITNRGTLEHGNTTLTIGESGKVQDASYSITLPEDCPATITLSIIRDSSGIKKLVYTTIQNVSKAPEFVLFPLLAGAYGTIKKETLLGNPSITLVPYNENYNLDWEQFTVTEFALTMIIDGDLVTQTAKGSKFSDRMIEMLNKTVKGQKIFIEDIRAVGDKGTRKQIRPFMAVID